MKFPSLVLLKTWSGPSSFANLDGLAYRRGGATVVGAAAEAINYRNIDSQFHELMIQYEHDFAR